MIIKATKKPITIEAVQWTGGNMIDITKFTEEKAWIETTDDMGYQLRISTLEGVLTAKEDDFIIKGVNGEFYPCKPDIFNKTYDYETTNTI